MSDLEWPDFLNKLDSNPDSAFSNFYNFAAKVLRTTPPTPMRNLPSHDTEELINDIIFHCVKDKFHVLRHYKAVGRPFAAWFYTIAMNKCRDYFRSRERQPQTISIYNDDPNEMSLEDILPNPGINGEKKVDLNQLLSITQESLNKLGEYCRMLLEMAADEFTPREMVAVLRLPSDQNKRVSDDLRECRRKLKSFLANDGYDLKSILTF